VSAIEAEGEGFDPNIHEALAQMEDERVPAGRVARMLQRGYRLRDRLLRPARVMVSKGPGPEK
jgi:molecular chaperone GrpE